MCTQTRTFQPGAHVFVIFLCRCRKVQFDFFFPSILNSSFIQPSLYFPHSILLHRRHGILFHHHHHHLPPSPLPLSRRLFSERGINISGSRFVQYFRKDQRKTTIRYKKERCERIRLIFVFSPAPPARSYRRPRAWTPTRVSSRRSTRCASRRTRPALSTRRRGRRCTRTSRTSTV